MIFEMDETTIYNLEKIISELIPNCNHPKNMRDRSLWTMVLHGLQSGSRTLLFLKISV